MGIKGKNYFVLSKICVSKLICNHLVGENHTHTHRCTVGLVIMGVGVGITKAALTVDVGIIHGVADLVGYGIHGVGDIPFVESIVRNKNG